MYRSYNLLFTYAVRRLLGNKKRERERILTNKFKDFFPSLALILYSSRSGRRVCLLSPVYGSCFLMHLKLCAFRTSAFISERLEEPKCSTLATEGGVYERTFLNQSLWVLHMHMERTKRHERRSNYPKITEAWPLDEHGSWGFGMESRM
jgi:hypothetical protein